MAHCYGKFSRSSEIHEKKNEKKREDKLIGSWKRGPTAPTEEKGILLRDLNAAEAGSKIRTENGNNNDDEKYTAVILAKRKRCSAFGYH